MKAKRFILSVLLVIFFYPAAAKRSRSIHNVVKLGAKGDGRSESSGAFLRAWSAACDSVRPTVVLVPRGRYLLNSINLGGKCKNSHITFRIKGTLVAPSDHEVGNWLTFEGVNGVSIHGGTIDGQGTALWACKAEAFDNKARICPTGATSLTLVNSRDMVIKGLTVINSQMFHTVINGCQNIKIRRMNITAPGNSPNTDGIHVQRSTDVRITRTSIKTGDDCISIGPGTTNLWIQNVLCGPGHGISIGSLAKDLREPGVKNVTVKGVTFTGTQNGLRIKSWGRPSSGFVKRVLFQNASMNNVENPIIIDQNYCPHNICPRQDSGVKISRVTYRDIQGTSATKVAVKFDCNAKNTCRRIRLVDVKLTHPNEPAQSSCTNAYGTAYGSVKPKSCLLRKK